MAEATPSSVAMKAPEIDGPERLGRVEVLEHVHEAQDGADDAHRRGEAAGLLERRRAERWRWRMPSISVSSTSRDELGVGAVDDELQALAREGVVDVGELLVERQQAVAARLLGEADELARRGPTRSGCSAANAFL